MSRDDALAQIAAWQTRGWLRSLDGAFARFIARHDTEASGITLLAAALASHQLGRSQTCLDLDALAADPAEALALTSDDDTNNDAPGFSVEAGVWLQALRKDRATVGDEDGATPLVLDGTRVYLRRYWTYETMVATRLRCLIDEGRLTVVTGGPGTGKTTSVRDRLQKLQDTADRPLRIALAAPTGKAAARLDPEATTLHRLLGRRPGSRHYRHHAGHPLLHDVVVVDEASMVDMEMTAQLLDALKPDARLILLGDKDQLASVEAGAVMADLCDTGGGHVVELTHSWRFGARPGIGALAQAVNAGDSEAVTTTWSAGHAELSRVVPLDEDSFRHVVIEEGYQPFIAACETGEPEAALDAQSRFQLLCALRAGDFGVDGLNARIEQALGIKKDSDWYHGRPVMVTRNDYALGLMNGDVGVALGDGERTWVWFRTADGVKRVLPSRLTDVETVFAMTVHKSQGSEFDHTALILPERTNPVLTRELLYTGITRSRDRFTLLAPSAEVFDYALARRTLRASGLAQRLGQRSATIR
jgi:exodeoxyribonuclease V alpha subunit